MEPEVIEPAGLEDRTAEVLRLLDEQRTSVLYVTGTCGVGKSTLGMRVGQALAGQLGEPFWAIDLCHAPPALSFARQIADLLGKSSPEAAESRGVLWPSRRPTVTRPVMVLTGRASLPPGQRVAQPAR